MLNTDQITELEAIYELLSTTFVKNAFPSLFNNRFKKIAHDEMIIFLSIYFYIVNAGIVDTKTYLIHVADRFFPEDKLFFVYRHQYYFDEFAKNADLDKDDSDDDYDESDDPVDNVISWKDVLHSVLIKALLYAKKNKRAADISSLKEQYLYGAIEKLEMTSKVTAFTAAHLPLFEKGIEIVVKVSRS